jgi:heat shock protein HspQ
MNEPSDIEVSNAAFAVGEIVHHRLFDYRGVIVDVDPEFALSDEWYEKVAKSQPPKDQPWYHVLVHGAMHATYVAERNLETDATGAPVLHPLLDQYFTGLEDGRYVSGGQTN